MKKSMKKIFAFALAISTVMTTAVSLGSVAYAENKANIRVETIDVSATEGYTVTEKTGYKPYIVNYYLSNFGMDQTVDEKELALAAVSFNFTVSDNSKIEQTSWTPVARSGKKKAANGQYGDPTVFGDPQIMTYDSDTNKVVFSWYGNQIDPYDWDKEDGNEEKLLVSNIVYVAETSSVTLTYIIANIELCEYDGELDSILKTYTTKDGTAAFSTSSITLGDSKKLVTGITVAANDMTVGDADQALTVTVTPDDATDKSYTLTSSNTDAATIVDGKIHAVAAGTTTIKATANDGSNVSGETTITISAKAEEKPSITIGDRAANSTGTGKAYAWLMIVKNFDEGYTYTGKITDSEKSKDLSFDFSGVTGNADVSRIVILKDSKSATTDPTFTATATK